MPGLVQFRNHPVEWAAAFFARLNHSDRLAKLVLTEPRSMRARLPVKVLSENRHRPFFDHLPQSPDGVIAVLHGTETTIDDLD